MEELEILYQDDNYIAINKPHGVLVHRTAVDKNETISCIQLLRDQIGQRVFPCHRLDKPTSGVLVFALNKDALKAVSLAFSSHEVEKSYHAIVRGWLNGQGTIDHPLRYPDDYGHRRGGDQAQPAVTDYICRSLYEIPVESGPHATSRFSMLELFPKTGRIHQLRRHLKHLSHPIIGDTRYGDGKQNRIFRQFFQSNRLLLCATSLKFKHPFTEINVIIEKAPDWALDLASINSPRKIE